MRPGRRLGRRARRAGAAALASAIACVALRAAEAQTAQPVPAAGADPPLEDAASPADAPLAPAAPVAPDRRTASLGWVRLPGASACAGGGAIARAVEAILRRAAIAPASRADLVIEARVERVAGGPRFRAVIEVTRPDGEVIGSRTLDSPRADCRSLDEPVALAIALMIDPEAMLRPAEAEPPPPAPPPITAVVRDVLFVPVPTLASGPLPPRRVEPPAQDGSWIGIAAAPSLALGVVPGVGAGVRAAFELGPPADVDAVGTTWGPSSIRLGVAAHGGSVEITDSPTADRATLSVGAVLGRLELCPTTAWFASRAAVTACAAFDAGALTYTSTGFDSPVDGDSLGFAAVGPSLRGRLRVAGPLAVELGVAAIAPLARDRLVFRRASGDRELAHQASAVAGTLDLGLHLAL